MLTLHHPLHGSAPGTCRTLTSLHFGPRDTGRKAYLQASLHADELPPMLVAHHLRQRLTALEADGRLRGEVVLVPVANPIGLDQTLLHRHHGRFELASGENFNRHYPALFEAALPLLEDRLGDDAQTNAASIRAALRQVVAAQPEPTELASLRKTLLGLACDAEVVLDLHCDAEALVHLYTGPALWPQAEPLARLVGAEVSLLASESGDQPFDEACSQPWWQLEAHFRGRFPVPMGCLSVTLELRGEADVAHPLAAGDADALVAFLRHRGIVAGPPPELPPLRNPATPLAGTDILRAPTTGMVVFLRRLGDRVRAGEPVLEVIDPLSGEVHRVASRTDGVLFAHELQRYARAGRSLAKVAGAAAVRAGKLSTD